LRFRCVDRQKKARGGGQQVESQVARAWRDECFSGPEVSRFPVFFWHDDDLRGWRK